MVVKAVKKLQERLKDMLNKFITVHESNPASLDTQGIVFLLMSTISGVGDKTATTMIAALYFMIRNPAEMKRLCTELAEAGVEREQVPLFTIVNRLPYLAAVIKESMRLFSVSTWPVERLVPAGEIVIRDIEIAEDTSVGVFTPSMHLDEEIFGRDAREFQPRRWIEAREERLQIMERAFMGFSRGRRVCLDQHVALMQMKKVLAMLVVSFDLTFDRAEADLEAETSLAVASLKPLLISAKRAALENATIGHWYQVSDLHACAQKRKEIGVNGTSWTARM